MNVIDALNWRYAVRKFSDEKLTAGQVRNLLTAVRLSASSYGLQPYRLLVVESARLRRRLVDYSMGQDKVVNCSHLLVFAVPRQIDADTVDRYVARVSAVRGIAPDELSALSAHIKEALASMTQQQRREWAHQQAHIALGNLLTCAALMQIDSCPMGGFEAPGYDSVLQLADRGLTTSVICAIGRRHPDDASARQRKVRFDEDEMIITL